MGDEQLTSHKDFLIRRATKDDVELIAEMGARLFRDTFGPDNRPEDVDEYIAASFSPAQIEAELADPMSTFLLAYKRDTPIGYARLRDGKLPDCVKGPRPIELVRIYVEQNIIGTGYGSALMQACLTEAGHGGYQTIWLDVWEKNERAIKFYRKWGFTEVGTQKFVLGSDIQNDLVMEKMVV